MKSIVPIICALACAAFLCSCETPGQSALLGAATGAIIGNQSYTGPLRGAALGAGAGYLIGKIAQHERRERYYDYDDRDYDDGYYRRYPVARPTNRYGFVTSPYRPYHLIDVRGIPRGAKVADPSNGRIFINP